MKYFNYATGLTMTNKKFSELFGYPVRDPSKDKLTQFHMDMAASIQKVTEEILIKIIKDLSKFSEVDYSEPKYKDFEDYIPNDPSYSSCWHLNKIQANLAWDLGIGNSNVVVSIVDDAITINHPDLQNVIWVNPNEIPNNGIDDDNDWDVKKHDTNGNLRPDRGEPNIDEDDEARIQRKALSLFPLLPTIGITWNF